MSVDGRSNWYAEDAGWLLWERTIILGEEFGPAAVAVMCAMKCAAKRQNDAWRFKHGWRSLAREAAMHGETEKVQEIVKRAADIGWLDDLDTSDTLTFTARIRGMLASERKGRDAIRKAESRAADSSDTSGQDRTVSASVRKVPPTGQDRTQQNIGLSQRSSGTRERDTFKIPDHDSIPF